MNVRAPRWSADPDRFELATMRAIAEEPRVWSGFVDEMFKQSTRPGIKRLSAKKAVEDARDRLHIHFNNTWTSELARAFCRTYPSHSSYVETRGKAVSFATVAA